MKLTYINGKYSCRWTLEGGTVVFENENVVRKAKDWSDGIKAVDALRDLSDKIAGYYAQPADVLNRDFVAQADANRARGWSND